MAKQDVILTFLAWCSFGSIIGWWVTQRRGLAGLIALVITSVGTILMIYPGLTGYWWLVLIAAVVAILSRRDLRSRAYLAGSLVIKILSRPNSYADRIRMVSADDWKDATIDLVEKKETLERDNEELTRTIRDLAMEHKRAYKIVRDVLDGQIDEDGTDTHTREMRIAAITETISWIDVGYGTTLQDPSTHGVTFERPLIRDGAGRRLNFQIYENETSRKRLLIFLREPLVVGGSEQVVKMSLRRVRCWADLIRRLEDFSLYEPQNIVDEFVLKVRIPTSLRIIDFEVSPAVGTVTIDPDRLSAGLVAAALRPGGTVRYTIRCARAT